MTWIFCIKLIQLFFYINSYLFTFSAVCLQLISCVFTFSAVYFQLVSCLFTKVAPPIGDFCKYDLCFKINDWPKVKCSTAAWRMHAVKNRAMYKLFGTVNSLELLDDFWRFYSDFGKNKVYSAFLLLFPKIVFAKVIFIFLKNAIKSLKIVRF